MARLSVIQQLGLFDENFRRTEDREIAVRLALSGGHFISVPRPLIAQHITLSPDKAGSIWKDTALAVLRKHKKYLIRRGTYRFSQVMVRVHIFGSNLEHQWKRKLYLALAFLLRPQFAMDRLLRKLSSDHSRTK